MGFDSPVAVYQREVHESVQYFASILVLITANRVGFIASRYKTRLLKKVLRGRCKIAPICIFDFVKTFCGWRKGQLNQDCIIKLHSSASVSVSVCHKVMKIVLVCAPRW